MEEQELIKLAVAIDRMDQSIAEDEQRLAEKKDQRRVLGVQFSQKLQAIAEVKAAALATKPDTAREEKVASEMTWGAVSVHEPNYAGALKRKLEKSFAAEVTLLKDAVAAMPENLKAQGKALSTFSFKYKANQDLVPPVLTGNSTRVWGIGPPVPADFKSTYHTAPIVAAAQLALVEDGDTDKMSTMEKVRQVFENNPYDVFNAQDLLFNHLPRPTSQGAVRQAIRRLFHEGVLIQETRGRYTLNPLHKSTHTVADDVAQHISDLEG